MGTQGLRTLEERSTLQLYSGFSSARYLVIKEGEKKTDESEHYKWDTHTPRNDCK